MPNTHTTTCPSPSPDAPTPHKPHDVAAEACRLQERLTRLEETLYFQEATIQQLNDALTHQQGQLDSLERQLNRALEKLDDVQAMVDQGPESTVPPHSIQRNL